MRYHKKHFLLLCDKLADYTEKCTISFLDLYKNMKYHIAPLGIRPPSFEEAEELAACFHEIATKHGISIDTCAEEMDLSTYGIGHAACIDRNRLERIGNYRLHVEKDKNQRIECGCVESVEIGTYNTCKNGCAYCYANYSLKSVETNAAKYDPLSPLLCGQVQEDDKITIRKVGSLKETQLSIFDM